MKMYKHEKSKNEKSKAKKKDLSENDFIYCLNYLPTLKILFF